MEQATAYKFSKGVRRAKIRYTILAITLPVILIAFLFLSPLNKDLSPIAMAIIVFSSFVLIGLTFYFSASRTLRKLSELSVYIFPDRIERQDEKQKEILFWKDLLNAKIIEYPKGEIGAIKLTFSKKKAITIFGFEDMESATKRIEQYIPNNALLHRKRAKVNWDNPAIIISSSVLTLLLILAVQKIGKEAYHFFNVIFFLALGLYNLIA